MSKLNNIEKLAADFEDNLAAMAALKKQLAPLVKLDAELRREIANACWEEVGGLEEGTNTVELNSGRKVKVKYEIDRKIESALIETARASIAKINDLPPGFVFDDMLRVKHELEKKVWNKLKDHAGAKAALADLIVATPKATPVVEYV